MGVTAILAMLPRTHLVNISFPIPRRLRMNFVFNWPNIMVSEKMFQMLTDDGRTPNALVYLVIAQMCAKNQVSMTKQNWRPQIGPWHYRAGLPDKSA